MPSRRWPSIAPHAALRGRELVAVALLLSFACEAADFQMRRRGTATIPNDGGEVEMMRLDDLELEIAELQSDRDIHRDDITDASLTKVRLEVLSPAGADLAFADSIELFAEAPGLERVRVAHRDAFPPGTRDVDLELDDIDLADYVAASEVTLIAVVDGEAPGQDVEVRAWADIDVGVTVRGACRNR